MLIHPARGAIHQGKNHKCIGVCSDYLDSAARTKAVQHDVTDDPLISHESSSFN